MAGVKETQEAALALIAVGKKVMQLVKEVKADGKIDLADLPKVLAIAQDQAFLDVVNAGLEGIGLIPGEISDLSLSEGIQVVGVVGPVLLGALDEVKKA